MRSTSAAAAIAGRPTAAHIARRRDDGYAGDGRQPVEHADLVE